MKKRGCVKKAVALLLWGIMVCSLAACGAGNQAGSDSDTVAGNGENAVSIADALTLLNTVWDSYGETEKFPAAGGDFSEENSVMDGPGKYGLEDAASLDAMLGLPEASVLKIDDAASLVHMMNANTFTCGVFHVGSSGDVSDVVSSLKNNILNREWMCGFPDKLVIITAGDYVVSAFGNEEMIATFKEKVMAAYEAAVLVCEEPIL